MAHNRIVSLQPRLPVADIAAATRFFRDVLGFECAFGEPTNADGFAIVHRDGLGIQLVSAGADRPPAQVTVWIQVADAAAEHERIRSLTAIEWGPEVYWYGSREFAVLVPDGHRVIFSSPTDEPPTCQP